MCAKALAAPTKTSKLFAALCGRQQIFTAGVLPDPLQVLTAGTPSIGLG